jgi:hypothetical protein
MAMLAIMSPEAVSVVEKNIATAVYQQKLKI